MKITRNLILLLGALSVGVFSGCSSCDDGSCEDTAGTSSGGVELSALKYGPEATFRARNELNVKVAEGTKSVRIWMQSPLESEGAQTVTNFNVEAPYPHRLTTDDHGNRAVYLEVNDPMAGEFKVVTTFDVARREVGIDWSKAEDRPLNASETARFAAELGPDQHVMIDENIRRLSREIVGSETRVVVKARRIYDWVLANIDYWVKDPKTRKASPVGSTEYCLSSKTGNCTDFHSLWTSLARAAGIPTRMKYGSFFKLELAGQDADQSYHCWPEFWAPGLGWVPHDVAVADIFVDVYPINDDNAKLVRLTTADGYKGPDANLVNWYFGNLDNRRVTFSIGRDLVLSPPSAISPVNALAKAHVEIDGKQAAEKEAWTRKLTFSEVK